MSIFQKRILGLDIHDYSAELVEVKQKGNQIYLESYNRILLPPQVIKNGEIKKPEELKTILKNLLNTSNPFPAECKNIAVIFPPSKVLTHIFTFPANLNEGEIRKSIPYEIETVIPFSINDVYWDFLILEKEEFSKPHASQYVFFACINKRLADDYADILTEAELSPYLFGINAESLKFAMIRPQNLNETNLIIDVGALSVNYLIIKDQIIKYYFSSNEGGKKLLSQISKEIQTPESLIIEKKEQNKLKSMPKIKAIEKFIYDNYSKAKTMIEEKINQKVIQKIDNIILTGEFLNLPDFYEMAKIHFSNTNVFIGDPKMNLYIDQQKFIPLTADNNVAMPYSTHFTNAIGIALRGIKNGNRSDCINLLPQELKESFSTKRNELGITIVAIFMAAISLFLATFLFFKYQDLAFKRLNLEIQKSSIEKMIYGTRYQQIRDEILTFNKEIEELSAIDSELFSFPLLLEEINTLIPEGIAIKSINFNDEDLSLSLTGIANTRDKLLKIQGNLKNAEFIEEIISPISNFDEKSQIPFLIQIKLDFAKLKKYGSSATAK